MFEVRGVWGGPRLCGTTRETVAKYLDKLQAHGFNAVYVNLKGGDGSLFWPSARFPQCVAKGYGQFDLPAVLLEECRKRGIQAHAWMIDFCEGEQGAAFREHPDWAMRDPNGNTTADEMLRGKRWGPVWMCPARRPGYTDQWLVPIYEEFASRYEFDTLHHDYVRYPGDAAPDRYCFCDYCLQEIPKWAGYFSERFPEEPFLHESYDRGYLEAHWEQSPRVLPESWGPPVRSRRHPPRTARQETQKGELNQGLPRTFQAGFLLEGSFFPGGRRDLDYFFYSYRTHWIGRFAREAREAVQRANPKVGISAAVFKNPIHSGRFIGQDWRNFAPYVDVAIPMNYRDHFPGTFDQYLELLEETIARQKEWAADFQALYCGIAVNFLFKEEPDGPYPQEKLMRAIERVASAGAPGIVIFCDDQLDRYGMWETAKTAFEGV